MCIRPETRGGSCKHGNELSGSIKGDHFLDMLSHYNSFSTWIQTKYLQNTSQTLFLPPYFALVSYLAHSSTLKIGGDMFHRNSVISHKTELFITTASQASARCTNRPDSASTTERTHENELSGRLWVYNWLRIRGNAGSDRHVTPTEKLTFCGLRTYSRDRLKSH
jgi:hypothetical protein